MKQQHLKVALVFISLLHMVSPEGQTFSYFLFTFINHTKKYNVN